MMARSFGLQKPEPVFLVWMYVWVVKEGTDFRLWKVFSEPF
jgi:hypothetical protein